jgi:hypothetical protein
MNLTTIFMMIMIILIIKETTIPLYKSSIKYDIILNINKAINSKFIGEKRI